MVVVGESDQGISVALVPVVVEVEILAVGGFWGSGELSDDGGS